jgi:hypothetical protein
MFVPNLDINNIYDKTDIINLDKTLQAKTTNYVLLVILHYTSTNTQSHNITINDNIHYCHLMV